MLVASTEIIEILYCMIFDFFEFFSLGVFLVVLFLLCVYIGLYNRDSNLQNIYVHIVIWTRVLLALLIPMCLSCEQILSGYIWCQNCGRKYFIENLSKWTSGNEIIDE